MLSRSEIRDALNARGSGQEDLFSEARRARAEAFGNEIVLRGVVEVTNVCRVDCDYCPMRRSNAGILDRFFMSAEGMANCARAIRDAGIDIVLLQGGETRRAVANVEAAIPLITQEYKDGVEILLNLGTLPRDEYARLRDLGATSYILKHETSDPVLFEKIRHEPLAERLRALQDLVDLGFHVGTGLISSLPEQSLESIVDDIALVDSFGVHMCSVSPFVPAHDTPLHDAPPGDLDLALNVIAVLRICYPHLLIPSVSALERTKSGGQARGLTAGANVCTINFTAAADRSRYLIYGDERFIVTRQHVDKMLAEADMVARGSIFLGADRAVR